MCEGAQGTRGKGRIKLGPRRLRGGAGRYQMNQFSENLLQVRHCPEPFKLNIPGREILLKHNSDLTTSLLKTLRGHFGTHRIKVQTVSYATEDAPALDPA